MKPGLQLLHKAGATGLVQSSQLSMQATHDDPDKVFPGLHVRQVFAAEQVKQISAHFEHCLLAFKK